MFELIKKSGKPWIRKKSKFIIQNLAETEVKEKQKMKKFLLIEGLD